MYYRELFEDLRLGRNEASSRQLPSTDLCCRCQIRCPFLANFLRFMDVPRHVGALVASRTHSMSTGTLSPKAGLVS